MGNIAGFTSSHSSFPAESIEYALGRAHPWVVSSCVAQMCWKSFASRRCLPPISPDIWPLISSGTSLRMPLMWTPSKTSTLHAEQRVRQPDKCPCSFPENPCPFLVSADPQPSRRAAMQDAAHCPSLSLERRARPVGDEWRHRRPARCHFVSQFFSFGINRTNTATFQWSAKQRCPILLRNRKGISASAVLHPRWKIDRSALICDQFKFADLQVTRGTSLPQRLKPDLLSRTGAHHFSAITTLEAKAIGLFFFSLSFQSIAGVIKYADLPEKNFTALNRALKHHRSTTNECTK